MLQLNLPFNHLDDNEFSLAIFELSSGPVRFTEDRLMSLRFNPLSSNPGRSLALSPDLDSDTNFFSQQNSEYYIKDQFNELLSQKLSQCPCLSFLHLNIRSLSRNLCGLTSLLSNLDNHFSVVGITETWLQSSSHSVDIAGYSFIHKHRTEKSGGGVGMYIKSEIEYKLRNDLIPSDQQSFESLFVEICRPKEKNIIVGTIYRPLLTKISREKNKLCYLLGDYNLNLIGHYCHQQTSDFLDLMYSCMFYPLIPPL